MFTLGPGTAASANGSDLPTGAAGAFPATSTSSLPSRCLYPLPGPLPTLLQPSQRTFPVFSLLLAFSHPFSTSAFSFRSSSPFSSLLKPPFICLLLGYSSASIMLRFLVSYFSASSRPVSISAFLLLLSHPSSSLKKVYFPFIFPFRHSPRAYYASPSPCFPSFLQALLLLFALASPDTTTATLFPSLLCSLRFSLVSLGPHSFSSLFNLFPLPLTHSLRPSLVP